MDFDLQWGGYYVSKEKGETEYGLFRILDFNKYSYQVAIFTEKFDVIPEFEDVLKLSPFIGHAPIDSRALLNERELHLIASKALELDDLVGYQYYLEEHEVDKNEIDELFKDLIDYSKAPPYKLRLSTNDEELIIEER